MIKHIFSDMDGTILNDAGDVSDITAQAIKKANIPVTLVSARAPIEMVDAMDKLGINTPQISFNGGLIFNKDNDHLKILHQDTINNNEGKDIVEIILDKFPEVSLSWYTLHSWYSQRIDSGILLEKKYTSLLPKITTAKDFYSEIGHELFKIMIITFEPNTMKALKEYLLAQNFSGVAIQQSSDTYLEITSKKAIKSKGVQYVMDEEQLAPAELMAFGDGLNDLPMMKMVDYPVAMKNSLPEVLEIAKFITKSNEENGIAYALQKYLPTI
ncbi:HAD family hydrolase [Companilactobacillus furfuricola]|uniref:HAD family hydrolase n=1 Tax=Companilactobacillus furfuricola TaxID=1462575 RepID=UPI0013DD8DE4|nr:HAD family hydrolase [Companilactobacillus furfuricola]